MQEHLMDARVLLSRANEERRNSQLQSRISELVSRPLRLPAQQG
jgi:hypothetical protein